MDLDTRLLRSFLTVAGELNFSRAAQRLHMSQQALSAQIQRLEQTVGVQLFARTTRYVRLTDAGLALEPYAQRMIDSSEQVARALRALAPDGGRRLRVGFSIGAALHLTAPILAEFAARCPDVAVELHEVPLRDPSAGLREHEVDAAFVRLPLGVEGLEVLELMRDPRVLVVAAGHPLASRPHVRFADFADAPLIACRTQDRVWDDFWLCADARDGVPGAISHEVSSLDEEMLLVASQGAMTVSGATAQRWPHPPGLAFLPVRDLEPSVIALAWHREATPDPALAGFAAAAFEVRRRNGASASDPTSSGAVTAAPYAAGPGAA
ncbi:LysR family transcriptional regulator [Streptomyces sp. NPDC001914]|uniref:LysR family transcriptional regulator n=1 Tax=Streptomyces sp. NPDC001914 TaxID=3364623 RepID=UPI0036CAD796